MPHTVIAWSRGRPVPTDDAPAPAIHTGRVMPVTPVLADRTASDACTPRFGRPISCEREPDHQKDEEAQREERKSSHWPEAATRAVRGQWRRRLLAD